MSTTTTFAESKKSNFLGTNINAYSPENDQATFQPDAYQSPNHFSYGFGQLNIRNSAPLAIQPKLTIGAPNDKYEQEADQVADRVIRMSVPAQNSAPSSAIPKVQRKCAGCQDELEGKLQTKNGARTVTMGHLLQAKFNDETEYYDDGRYKIVREDTSVGNGATIINVSDSSVQVNITEDTTIYYDNNNDYFIPHSDGSISTRTNGHDEDYSNYKEFLDSTR